MPNGPSSPGTLVGAAKLGGWAFANQAAYPDFCTVEHNYLTAEALDRFIELALREDVGEGDHSSLAAVPEGAVRRARLLVKDHGVIAGLALAERILAKVDPTAKVELFFADGQEVKVGDVAFTVEGKARAILMAERLLLNCMQRMSGIATYTRQLVALTQGTKAKILDTRKTTPNFRLMEKWAVKIGGGQNHRFGLFDMIMLKDNHIDYAGGIRPAIEAAQRYRQQLAQPLRIEVETRNLEEVRQVLAVGGVDVIMLDNMDLPTMTQAVGLIAGRYPTEASGGLTHADIAAVAACGVDYISIGALTHSVKSLDLSLKAF